MRHIVSRENPLFRDLVALAGSARERRRQGASLIEGIHLCEAYQQRHGQPRLAIVAESALRHSAVEALLAGLDRTPTLLADPLFSALSAVEHGVGVAFVVETPRPPLPVLIETDAVYLDRLQDPGNVGTILRTCAASGVTRILTAPGTAWCWSPKVLRAGMGAHFHLDIHEAIPWQAIAAGLRVDVLVTASDSAVPLYRADLRAPCLWIFGREGEGVSDELLAAAGLRIAIPQSPAVESLNVGVAAAICLYEQLRQRRF